MAKASSFALRYRGNVAKNKTHFFYVLYSDKTHVFNQSERSQGLIYIINIKTIHIPINVKHIVPGMGGISCICGWLEQTVSCSNSPRYGLKSFGKSPTYVCLTPSPTAA